MKNKFIKILCCFFLALLFSCNATPSTDEINFLDYRITQTIRSDKEHRVIQTLIYVTDEAGYRYSDTVLGSLDETVKFSVFNNEWNKISEKEEDNFHEELLKAGISNLKTETKDDDSDYRSTLQVRLNGRDITLNFYTPPDSNIRKSVHNVIINFANRIGMDRPKALQNAVTVTEGDTAEARKINLEELLVNKNEFNGKRVSVVGYYHGEYESDGIYTHKDWVNNRSVWKGFVSSFADPNNIKIKNDTWLHVEGIFLIGPAGTFGVWPGQITRLTKVQPISEQDVLQGPCDKTPCVALSGH